MPDTSIKDFEAAIAELESIIKKLEEGDLALEQSLVLYERGVQLSRFCHTQLEQAERRTEILNERGELSPPPGSFAPEDPGRVGLRDDRSARRISLHRPDACRRGARTLPAEAA